MVPVKLSGPMWDPANLHCTREFVWLGAVAQSLVQGTLKVIGAGEFEGGVGPEMLGEQGEEG